MTNIYVGNLPYDTTQADLEKTFGAYGTVTRATIIIDRETGKARGFGFVEMEGDGEADAAIEALNGTQLGGRTLVVNKARPKTNDRG